MNHVRKAGLTTRAASMLRDLARRIEGRGPRPGDAGRGRVADAESYFAERPDYERAAIDPVVMTREEGARALREDLLERRRIFEKAVQLPQFAVQLGASNMPHDCTIWASDWRERLPSGHPLRVEAEASGTMNSAGSRGARAVSRSAHRALLEAARQSGNAGP